MAKAEIVVESAAKRFDMTSGEWEGIDFTQMSDEELGALGIDPSEVDRPDEDEADNNGDEDLDDNEDDSDDDNEGDDGEDDEGSGDDSDEDSDEDEDGDDPDEDEDDDSDAEISIPKARFDEAVRKEREKSEALEDRTAFLEEQIDKLISLQATKKEEPAAPPAPKIDVNALEKEYMDKVLAGETDEATAIRITINDEQQRVLNEMLKQAKAEAKAEAQNISEDDKFKLAIADAANKHPQLNSEDDTNYDPEIVEQVNALAIGFQQYKNMTPSTALTKAVNSLLKKPAAPKKTSKTSKAAARRKADKAQKVASTPAKAKASAVRDVVPDDIDWENLSEDQFDRLYKKNPSLVSKQLGM